MGIRRYPRPGQKISPDTLAPVLDVPIPWRLLSQEESIEGNLADLDESTWDRLSPNLCAKLGAAVVREISSRIASLPESILKKKLPLPENWKDYIESSLGEIPLEARTYNCLVAEGLLESPERLVDLTIEDLLKIRSFGAKSLVDLLATLESLESLAQSQKSLGPEDRVKLEALKPKIQKWPRPGQRLAPKSLAEILGAQIPTNIRRRYGLELTHLRDLDETLWERLDTLIIAKLGDLVIQEVDTHLPSLPPNIIYKPLPLPPKGVGLKDVEIERRTYNCLKREGLLDDPAQLYSLTIGDFLQYRGVGGKSLVDFLTALEDCQPRPIREENLSPHGHKEALENASRLRSLIGDFDIGRDDPRFGTLLRTLDPTVSSLGEVFRGIDDNRYSEAQLRAMSHELGELEKRVRESHSTPLHDEFVQVTTVGLSPRDAKIIGHYFGWEGDGPQTLKQIGEKFDLTRERVRQIGVEQATRVEQSKPFVPVFERAVQVVSESLPVSDEQLPGIFRRHEIDSEGRILLRTLEQGSKLFGVELPFLVAEIQGKSLALPVGSDAVVSAVTKNSRRQCDGWGLSSLAELRASLGMSVLSLEGGNLIEAILSTMSGFDWLDRERGWYWFGPSDRNLLVQQLRKLLSVATKIDLVRTRASLVAAYRRREIAPPFSVIREFIAKLPEAKVDGGTLLRGTGYDNLPDPLGPTERLIVDLLGQATSGVDRQDFEDSCVKLGINRTTLYKKMKRLDISYETVVATV